MQLSRRKKIVIAIIVLLVIIGVLFLVWRLSKEPGKSPSNEVEQPVFRAPSANLEFKPIEVPPIDSTEFTILNLAKSYAARFGSWSTDNQGHNLEELMPISTTKMAAYLKSIEPIDSQKFLGITTKSISAEISAQSDKTAEVKVNTQRIETNEKLEQKVYYQDILVSLMKNGDQWLVDAAFWQENK